MTLLRNLFYGIGRFFGMRRRIRPVRMIQQLPPYAFK